ncbi:MAG: tyrosine-type recombinase/integrase [Desulfobacteraceae bacterium]|nr:tyrosine-type recombinase/integrase [Desulfobacteraceae bacterium]
MPAKERFKTKYPGVTFIEGTFLYNGKPERIYNIRYRKDGKSIEEKIGRQSEGMTPARAALKRADRISGKELSNKERRQNEDAKKKADEGRWTIDKLWNSYKEERTENKSLKIDAGRYEKFLKDPFGKKEPEEILMLDVDKLRLRILKKKSPQTVVHILNLLERIVNYGYKRGLCDRLKFHIQKPRLNNIKTEDLTADQLEALLQAIDADENIQAKNLMKMALFSGMRRGELFKLKWADVDFNRGFITIKDPKGGPDQVIPLNDGSRDLLESHVRTKSEYVFPGRGGRQRVDSNKQVNRIKKRAGLPKDFRPLHGLRHVYASMLASSGEVDLFTIQKLLTHKDPRMTQRYAHLKDQALKDASQVAGDIVNGAMKGKKEDQKVVNLKR